MTRRSLLGLLALGLAGCATAKPKTATTPALKCVVCGVALDHYNWYGEEGPFCDKHLEERMAKDRPKNGLRSSVWSSTTDVHHRWHPLWPYYA